MNFVKRVTILCVLICNSYAIHTKQEGLIPNYKPYDIKTLLFFVPYNPTVIVVGDRIADFISAFAEAKKGAIVYGFTADPTDFENLCCLGSRSPNLRSYFGLLNDLQNESNIFYSTLAHDIPNESYYHFAGSVLPPTDSIKSFLFGPSYQVPVYNFFNFCRSEGVKKIHLINLDCGGNEIKVLKSIQEYLKDAIVVLLKTYHQEIRKEISRFEQIHELMTTQGYELLSHYIYDGVIGDALYVKSKYVTAVFRANEF